MTDTEASPLSDDERAELEALQSRLNEEQLTAPDRIRVIQSAVPPSED